MAIIYSTFQALLRWCRRDRRWRVTTKEPLAKLGAAQEFVETANWRGLEPFALPGISGDETVTLSHESEMANQPSKAASAGLEPRISVVVLEVRMGVTPMRGVFFSNRHVDVRISDLHNHMDVRFGDMENRFEARFAAETRVNDANFRLVLSKIDDLDVRLTRLEERFAR